jgi:hypothetical protein
MPQQTPSWVHWMVGALDAVDEFQKLAEKVPEQIAEQARRLFTPGDPQNKGAIAKRQRELLAIARDPKKPAVARVEAAGEALKMQPASVVEETVVRPAMEAPGHAKAAGVHLAQAEQAKSPVEKAVHALEATKEAAQAFNGFAAPAAIATAGARPAAAGVPEAGMAPQAVRGVRAAAASEEVGSASEVSASTADSELAKVGWDDPLFQQILELRRARVEAGEAISPGRNVAVARYETEAGEGFAFGVSRGRHAERFAKSAVPEGAQMKELGTELQPCGADYHNCGAYLEREAPGVPVKYIYDYPAYDKAARRASSRMKTKEVGALQEAKE